MENICIFVYGTGRSGTSAIAGTLNRLGIPIGNKVIPATEANQKGYYENFTAVDINETLLKHLRIQYNFDFLPPENWWNEKWTKPFEFLIENFLKDEFPRKDIFLIKDPRLSILLPLWLKVINKLAISHRHIIGLRHPEEVHKSLAKRDSEIRNTTLLRWLNYYFWAELYSRNAPRAVVSYDQLIATPLKIFEQISEQLQLSDYININPNTINSFIDKSLKHHKFSEDLSIPEYLPVYQLYNTLLTKSIDLTKTQNKLDDLRTKYMGMNRFFYHEAYLRQLFLYENCIAKNQLHIATFWIADKKKREYLDIEIHHWKNYWRLTPSMFNQQSFPNKLWFRPSNYEDKFLIEQIVGVTKNKFVPIPYQTKLNGKLILQINNLSIHEIYFYIKYDIKNNTHRTRRMKRLFYTYLKHAR